MKIKEVETKTKLSSKTIRFYEDKGLIQIQRDQSGYRDYTEENIEELMKIKLYRQCGLSIQEIIDVQKGHLILNDILYDKISEYDKKNLELSDQKELCLDVIKAKGNYDELFEYIEIKESDEFNNFMNELMDTPQRSLAIQLFMSVILLGPILNFLLYLSEQHIERLLYSFLFSLVATVILTLSWRKFISEYKFHKETIKEGILHTIRILAIIILLLICVIGVFAGLTFIQHSLYIKEDVYILAESHFSIFFLLLTSASILIFILSHYAEHYQFEEYHHYIGIVKWLKKHMLLYIGICLLAVYLFMTNVTVISPQKVIYYSCLNPLGIQYTYDDIESIECGFYGKGFHLFHDAGDFYYNVQMKDGKTFSLNDTETIEKYEDDTYSEIEEFDKEVMKYHVKKTSSDKNSEYAMLDKVYIERFISIINNK